MTETQTELVARLRRERDQALAREAVLIAALTVIKRAGKARMSSYGDEHSYYFYTASAALGVKP